MLLPASVSVRQLTVEQETLVYKDLWIEQSTLKYIEAQLGIEEEKQRDGGLSIYSTLQHKIHNFERY